MLAVSCFYSAWSNKKGRKHIASRTGVPPRCCWKEDNVHTPLKKCKPCPPQSRCEEGDALRGVGWWSCWKEVGGLSIELLLTSAGQEWLSPEAVQCCLDRWEECIQISKFICSKQFVGFYSRCLYIMPIRISLSLAMRQEENPGLCSDILVVFKVEPDNRNGKGRAEDGERRKPRV